MNTMRGLKLAAFALSLAAFASACSGGSQAKPTPSASLSPVESPTATATAALSEVPSPTPVDYPEPASIPLTYGGPVDFPSGIVMYARDASWEGPTNAIRRYYRSPDRVFHTEPLLESIWNFEDQSKMRAINSSTSANSGTQIAATLCHGSCYGAQQPVTVVRSLDGGVTWDDLGERPESGWVIAIADSEVWFNGWEWKVTALPSAKPIDLPGFAPGVVSIFPTPGIGTGMGLWRERENVVRDPLTGGVLVTLPIPAKDERLSASAFTDRTGKTSIAVNFGLLGDAPQYVGLFDPVAGSWRQVFKFSYEDPVAGSYPAGWLDATQLLGRTNFKRALLGYPPAGTQDISVGVPSILDVTTGVVSPIREFMPKSLGKAGGPVPFAVAIGTFARITTPGDCLNVRKTADRTSESLGCFADRVLLKVTGDAASGWLPVFTPEGRTGFASAEFLTPATR